MKALLISFILGFIHVAQANQSPLLKVGPAQPVQFTHKESMEGDKIVIQRVGVKKPIVLKYTTTTVSQTSRLHIELQNSKQQKKAIDLLVVASTTGARTQLVEVFIPVRSDDFIIAKNVSPVCSLANFGGFYADESEDLLKMFQVEEKNGRVVLSAMIRANEQAEIKKTTCFEVMLNAK